MCRRSIFVRFDCCRGVSGRVLKVSLPGVDTGVSGPAPEKREKRLSRVDRRGSARGGGGVSSPKSSPSSLAELAVPARARGRRRRASEAPPGVWASAAARRPRRRFIADTARCSTAPSSARGRGPRAGRRRRPPRPRRRPTAARNGPTAARRRPGARGPARSARAGPRPPSSRSRRARSASAAPRRRRPPPRPRPSGPPRPWPPPPSTTVPLRLSSDGWRVGMRRPLLRDARGATSSTSVSRDESRSCAGLWTSSGGASSAPQKSPERPDGAQRAQRRALSASTSSSRFAGPGGGAPCRAKRGCMSRIQ